MESNNPYNSPADSTSASSPATGLRAVRVKRVDPISAATMVGALYVFLGLFIGVIMVLISLVGVATGGGGDVAIGALMGGVGGLIGLPILYGVIGFVAGLIGAVIYNIVAGFVGGIRVDLEG